MKNENQKYNKDYASLLSRSWGYTVGTLDFVNMMIDKYENCAPVEHLYNRAEMLGNELDFIACEILHYREIDPELYSEYFYDDLIDDVESFMNATVWTD